jgi:hypothetical protein
MKYKTPELTALTLAIDAIQAQKPHSGLGDAPVYDEVIAAYEDWE